MGLKIWCQVGEFEFHFQNPYGEMCFWKIMLKVRSFKSTGDHRPFLSNFDVKLGSWGIIHTGEHSPLEVSTKPLHLPPGSSAGFTPRARSASLMGWVDGWVGRSIKFLHQFQGRRYHKNRTFFGPESRNPRKKSWNPMWQKLESKKKFFGGIPESFHGIFCRIPRIPVFFCFFL